MNAERLLAHFERISEAPDAIARLKQFILDLAVRGKLVEQDPGDESADQWLSCIANHAKTSHLEDNKESPFPFSLPTGWTHTKLRSLVSSSCSGWSPKTLDTPREGDEWGILKVSAVSWDQFRPEANKQVLPGTQPKPQAVIRKGDFLISRANTAQLVARAVIVESEPINLMMSDKIVRLELVEPCEPKYILINNNYSSFSRNYYAERATGVSPSMKNVTRDVILDLPIPLPPLAEQRRIVAKVDELMALCDRLEVSRQQREQNRERLVSASLQRLNQPAHDPASFRLNANLAVQILPALATTPAQIKQLRQTILNLAARGKLVEQDPKEERAEEQLERIILAKAQLGRKQRVSSKKRHQLGHKSSLYDLPSGWTTANLADLVTILNGRAYKQAELLDSGTPVLRVGNLFTSNKWYYSDLTLDEDKYIDNGDLIFAWSASFGPFIWQGGRVIYHYHIWKLLLHSAADLSRDYLYLYLLHKTAEIKAAGQGTSMVHMTKEKMELLEVLLPPLAEQHRIVAKVEELTTLCSRLEGQLGLADQHRQKLLDALLAEALVESKRSLAAAGSD